MQDADGPDAEWATSTARVNEGALHGTPPATPQQLRAAVAALTDQLDSAKKSLMGCVGTPAAQRQLDASLARCAEPVQAMLAGQRLTALAPSQELAASQLGAGTASVSEVMLLPTAAHDGNSPEAAPKQQKPATAAAATAELSAPEADISKPPAATVALPACVAVSKHTAEQASVEDSAPLVTARASASGRPPAMPDLSAAMTLLQIGRGSRSGCGSEAAEAGVAADDAQPTPATTEIPLKPPSGNHGLEMSEAPKLSRPGTPAPHDLAQAAAGSHEPSGERPEQGSVALSKSEGSGQDADAAAAAQCPAKTLAEGETVSKGSLTHPNRSSTAVAGGGGAAGCNSQDMRLTVQTAILTERDTSPDFGGGSEEGEGVQGRVMDTVGKLCRDIDPMQSHAFDSEKTQTAKTVWTDPQAAAMPAKPAASAKAGSQVHSVEGLQRPTRATEAQRLGHSAHASLSGLSHNAAAAGACGEGSEASEPLAADEGSAGSAGSWKSCLEEADGLHPGKTADTALAGTSAPGKQPAANEAAYEVLPATARGVRPATSALLGRVVTSSRQSARAASRAPSRSERAQAEHSIGGKLSHTAQAAPEQAQGRGTPRGPSSKAFASAHTALDGDSTTHSGSSAGTKTNVNTPLTPGDIFGYACGSVVC